ncbi:hypothetical protein D3C78_1060580 [compost metagenome]
MCGVLAKHIIQIALEVACYLNVHRRAVRCAEVAWLVHTLKYEALQYIVFIRCKNQLAYRKAHALRQIACEYIAKVACRHAEINLLRACFLRHLEVRIEVVNGLRHNAHEVNRVNSSQMVACLEIKIGEQILDHPLAIVEVAVYRQIQHIIVLYRCHLQLLHPAYLAVRVKNANLNAVLALHAFDGGSASISGGCAQNMNFLILLRSHIGIQLPHKLQRNILESEGRTVEQLQQIQIVLQLADRRNFRITEGRVACIDHILQILLGNFSVCII